MARKDDKNVVRQQIARQVADEDASNLLRSLPQCLQNQLARMSNTRRPTDANTSNQGAINPTPVNRGPPQQRINSSGIPLASSSTLRKSKPISNFNIAKLPPTGRPVPPAWKQMGSTQNLAKAKDFSFASRNSTFAARRSMSVDSLYREGGVTPVGFTPGGRTGGASNCSILSNGNYSVAKKTIKIPNASEKGVLNGMAHDVNSYLESKRYSRRMTLSEFNKMPSSEYVNICVFVGTLMMGPSYFQGKPDPSARLFELANLLQYPGQISKSHIKCANIPHSWPYALTFLSWLCARVEAAISPALFSTPVSEIAQIDCKQVAVESYLKLFLHKNANEGAMDPEVVEEELQLFKNKLQEKVMGDIPQTTEELEAIRDAELNKLKNLECLPFPTKSFREAKDTYEKILKDSQDKLEDSKKTWESYKNVSSLQAQTKALEWKSQEEEKKLRDLQDFVRKQPFDKTEAEQMKQEIEAINSQIKVAETMANKYNSQITMKKIQYANVENGFDKVCAQFDIVDAFKEAARRLHVQLPEIPPNPYDPSGLKTWIDDIESTQELAMEKIITLEKEVQANLAKLNANEKERLQTKELVERKKAKVEGKFEELRAQLKLALREQENQVSKIKEDDKKMEDERLLLTDELDTLKEERSNLQTKLDNTHSEMAQRKTEEDEWKLKAENLTIDLMEEADEMNAYMKNYIITKATELRDIRRAANLDVELFDELLQEFEDNGYPQVGLNGLTDHLGTR